MSNPGDKPKHRPRRTKLVPLLMLGSDGETYACAPAADLPRSILANPNTVVASRLSRRERDIALDSLQDGVQTTARLLRGIVGRRRFNA
jgi:hypothetical protein